MTSEVFESAFRSRGPRNANSLAQASALQVKASQGVLFGFSVYSNGVTQWIQLHNAISAPADTAVPVLVFPVTTDTTLTVDFGYYGRMFSTGIYICNSTTDVTKTLGAANCIFDAQYV